MIVIIKIKKNKQMINESIKFLILIVFLIFIILKKINFKILKKIKVKVIRISLKIFVKNISDVALLIAADLFKKLISKIKT